MTNSEWAYVEQAKAGDVHAFAKLYEKYYKDLYYFSLSMTGNEHKAEDAVSGATLKAYENLKKLRRSSSFKSWIFQITANECRRLCRQKELFIEDVGAQEESTTDDGFSNSFVAETLAILEPEERLVVTLSIFAGYNSREIGTAIGKKEGSVRSIKSRAFAKLRTRLDK
ncbi:MAG: sigma-70 family RNA polymerase sigma factor [Eubacterium sp.]|nr:sigma-70 family RNA polymerase sigma factor [Eubacterium sp.]